MHFTTVLTKYHVFFLSCDVILTRVRYVPDREIQNLNNAKLHNTYRCGVNIEE